MQGAEIVTGDGDTYVGWFSIPGVQNGKYTLKDRLFALNDVRGKACGKTILDIGCAEGLISKWLVDVWGAKTVHGIEKHEPYIETARRVMGRYDAKYFNVDLDFFEMWLEGNSAELLPKYDIVLALRVVQKLARPDYFLRALAPLVGRYIVIQAPTNLRGVMVDGRSGSRPFDFQNAMGPKFKLAHVDIRPMQRDHEFTGTFARIAQ